MSNAKHKSSARKLTRAELEAASREFDQADYAPRFNKAPAGEQRRHDRAIAAAKRRRQGRPPVGKGAARIQITVERTLLSAADTMARRERMSRSELIARGLRLALGS